MELAVDNSKQTERKSKAATQRGSATNAAPELHPALQLQQQVGNQAVQQLLRSGAIRAKLAVSQPNDPEEQEADATADRIMRSHAGVGAAATSCSCGTDEEEMCDECRQKAASISRKAADSGPSHTSSHVLDTIKRSSGHPLDAATRAFFEPRFGRDFSNVRVHNDASAAASARSIQARAYAADNHLVFDTGQFAPETEEGRRLLAHELTHVTQRRNSTHEPPIRRQPNSSTTGQPRSYGHVLFVQVDRTANTITFVTESGSLVYSLLSPTDVPSGTYRFAVSVTGNNLQLTKPAEVTSNAQFRYRIAAGQPNPASLLRGEHEVTVQVIEGAGSSAESTGTQNQAQDTETSKVHFQVEVLTPQAFQAMTGVSANNLPEQQLVSAATIGTGLGMTTSGWFGGPSAGMAAANPSGPTGAAITSPAPVDASSPVGRVVAFGLANRDYMGVAEANTGLKAINIQDFITWNPWMNKPMPPGWPYFPSDPKGPTMEEVFANPVRPGGLDPMFSGVMAQEALEGNAAGTVHFDMRGSPTRPFELTPPLSQGDFPGFSLQDLHSASEARQGIAYLASTGPGERNVRIVIQHENGVTTISPESNVIEGAPLPEWIANRMPNIGNTPPAPTTGGGGPGVGGPAFTPAAGGAVSFLRVGGAILMIYGAYRSIERIRNAPEAERPRVEMEEGGSWIGGALGSALGTAGAAAVFCLPAGPADFICVAGGFVGGLIVGTIGGAIGSAVGDVVDDVGGAIQDWMMEKAGEAYMHQIEQQGDPIPPEAEPAVDEILGDPIDLR